MADNSQIEFKTLPKGEVDAICQDEPWNNTQMDWKVKLTQIPEFNSDLDKSAEILFQIAQGIKATKDKLQSEGLVSYKSPILAIAYGTDLAKHMSMVHNTDENTDAVIIGVNFLNAFSKLNFQRIGYLDRPDGTTFFHGYANDAAFLLGVEEAHHSSYTQFKNDRPPSVDGSGAPIEVYDAIEHEFRALVFQHQIAMERKMPQETIDFLANRIRNAKVVRGKNSEPHTLKVE